MREHPSPGLSPLGRGVLHSKLPLPFRERAGVRVVRALGEGYHRTIHQASFGGIICNVSHPSRNPQPSPTVTKIAYTCRKILWNHLRNHQLNGLKFRRQHPIGCYIVDFYCARCRLIIEVDGPSHQRQIEYDAERTRWLNDYRYQVVRFSNNEVSEQIETVLKAIVERCEQIIFPQQTYPNQGVESSPPDSLSLSGRGSG